MNIQKRVRKQGNCLIWTGAHTANGYGLIQRDGRGQVVHRYLYEQQFGKITDGLELDHTCKNSLCVNIKHLEVVTHAENMRRAQKTVCKNGHALTPENVYVYHYNGVKWPRRVCKACSSDKGKRWRSKQG